MENRLLNRERIERMISAPSEDEALKVLDECGYGSTVTAAWKAAWRAPGPLCLTRCRRRCQSPGWWMCSG
ncbi:MAG: hypothetical protein ACLRPX_09225 [Ruthenibacterium sp.]